MPIVAVFAVHLSQYDYRTHGFGTPLLYEDEWRQGLKHAFEQDWCAPLRQSRLQFQTVIEDGRPASVILAAAERMKADMIVIGRRGRSAIAEMLMGSVSYELSHHSRRPVTLISSSNRARRP